jgi:AraC-like DNA-binding protein
MSAFVPESAGFPAFSRLEVHCFRPLPGWDFSQPHRHAWHELVYVDQGVYRVHVQDEMLVFHTGEAVVYPAHTEHHPQPVLDRSLMLYLLQWAGGDAELPFNHCFRIWDGQRRVLDLLGWLWRLSLAPDHAERRLAETLAHTLIASLWTSIEPGRERRTADQADRLHRAVIFMEANTNSNMTLDDVAEFMQVSRSQAVRIFKRQLGLSPMRYLQRLRVDLALRLLRGSRASLDEIAQQSGLGSAAYLARLVKAATGKTPTGVRESV